MHTVTDTYRYKKSQISSYFLDKSKHNKYKLLKHVVYKKNPLGLPLSTKHAHAHHVSVFEKDCVDLF